MLAALVLLLVLLTVLNLAFEWLPVEVYSLLLMVALVVLRVLSPEQAFSAFGSSAVLMIAGVMLLTGGVIHNGVADILARQIQRLAGSSERRMSLLLLTVVNLVSSVINNVAATAMFIPVAEGLARRFHVNRGRYLMPIAFASMTGGMCTLIGTSTNVAVSGAMEQHGLEPLGMFELAPVGVAVALAGMAYLLWIAPRILRLQPEAQAEETYGIKGFLFEVEVRPEAAVAGRTIAQADLGRTYGVTVLAIFRGAERIVSPEGHERIAPGDLLLVEGHAHTVLTLMGAQGLDVRRMPSLDRSEFRAENVRLAEATVSYNSWFIDKTLKELDFRHRYELTVLAIHRRGEVLVEKVGKIPLASGDVLLVFGRGDRFARLAEEPTTLIIESTIAPAARPWRAALATAIFGAAIAVGAASRLDVATVFLAGGALVVATGCLPARQIGGHVNFRFLVMIAALTALGMAMESSGAAARLAAAVVGAVPASQPLLLLGAFAVLTVLLTQPLSNAAAGVLMLPVALQAAAQAGLAPRGVAVVITLAASCSFITPFEPACLLVYSTGHYRFIDFVRVGTLLTLIALGVCLLLVPRIWPLLG